MNNEELLKLFHQGFVPFNKETEENYRQRVLFGLDIENMLNQHMDQNLPPRVPILKSALDKIESLYGFRAEWVPLIYSDEKMLPWQGAAAWIFELYQNAPLSSLIQVRKNSWSFLASNEERLSHELCHVGRMGFEEKQYEEIMAYQTSPNKLRRFFGPLFQSSFDSIALVGLLGTVVSFDFVLLLSGAYTWYDHFMWLKLIPLFFLVYLLVRLVLRQRKFKALVQKTNLPFVYSLLDKEINTFSGMPKEAIQENVEKNKHLSLRQQLMSLLITKP